MKKKSTLFLSLAIAISGLSGYIDLGLKKPMQMMLRLNRLNLTC